MSGELTGMLRLVHQVTGFLLRLTPAQLRDVVDGRLALSVQGADEGAAPAAPDRATIPEPRRERAPREVPAPSPAKTTRRSPSAPDEEDFAEIAAALRRQDTVDDGLAYLDKLPFRNGRGLTKDDLLAVARHMNLPVASSAKKDFLLRAVLKHSIGNRRQAEGLRP